MSKDFSLGSVAVPLTPSERFEQYLRSRGKRITQPRRILVQQVFSRHEHFDADDLMDDLARRGGPRSERPSRPTVYRTLAELVEAGMLRKMIIRGRTVYEHDYGYPQHDHLHCNRCNKLIEFRSDELTRIRDSVARNHGFSVTSHRLIINGLCERCQGRRDE
jgi:Fur family ferric uptake transcriptional regulator